MLGRLLCLLGLHYRVGYRHDGRDGVHTGWFCARCAVCRRYT